MPLSVAADRLSARFLRHANHSPHKEQTRPVWGLTARLHPTILPCQPSVGRAHDILLGFGQTFSRVLSNIISRSFNIHITRERELLCRRTVGGGACVRSFYSTNYSSTRNTKPYCSATSTTGNTVLSLRHAKLVSFRAVVS